MLYSKQSSLLFPGFPSYVTQLLSKRRNSTRCPQSKENSSAGCGNMREKQLKIQKTRHRFGGNGLFPPRRVALRACLPVDKWRSVPHRAASLHLQPLLWLSGAAVHQHRASGVAPQLPGHRRGTGNTLMLTAIVPSQVIRKVEARKHLTRKRKEDWRNSEAGRELESTLALF